MMEATLWVLFRRRYHLFMLTLWMTVAGCGVTDRPLRIAAAGNTRYVVETLIANYEQETGIAPQVVIASSGKLTAQIMQGAPFDLLLSADFKYPEELVAAGLTMGGVTHYSTGKLVLWGLNESATSDLSRLLEATQIAIANPELAPYGAAAKEVLIKLDLWDQVQDQLVYGESVGQVNQFVLSGAAEVGFTAQSVVMAEIAKDRGNWQTLDNKLHTPIKQGLVVLKNGNESLAQDFVSYLNSEQARVIFERFGYLLPE